MSDHNFAGAGGEVPKPAHRRRLAVYGLVLAALILAATGFAREASAGAVPSPAQVLHLYSETASLEFLSPTDQLLPGPPKNPVPGDQIEEWGNDYVGNHVHHAAQATASDHEICVFVSFKQPVRCYAQIAIGGSMIFGIGGLTRSLSEPFALTGGTGAFAGITGTGLAVSMSEAPTANTDLTITLHRR